MSDRHNDSDLEFEKLLEQRIRDNFAPPTHEGVSISNEQLKEMSKKLPEWSLEPPYSFLK